MFQVVVVLIFSLFSLPPFFTIFLSYHYFTHHPFPQSHPLLSSCLFLYLSLTTCLFFPFTSYLCPYIPLLLCSCQPFTLVVRGPAATGSSEAEGHADSGDS